MPGWREVLVTPAAGVRPRSESVTGTRAVSQNGRTRCPHSRRHVGGQCGHQGELRVLERRGPRGWRPGGPTPHGGEGGVLPSHRPPGSRGCGASGRGRTHRGSSLVTPNRSSSRLPTRPRGGWKGQRRGQGGTWAPAQPPPGDPQPDAVCRLREIKIKLKTGGGTPKAVCKREGGWVGLHQN